MREQPIGAPSGPTDFALGPALMGRLPVRLSRKRREGRSLSVPWADIESNQEEAVQADETYRGPGRS
ncbi:hypothetical protein PoB_005353200 [Plakobranchus ocellatus]|uniref:Uncharacterized protein n=1 Tax=Plakobranchus ocellatus TaxID=259542 RepID=A0AAV4C609_9GAST|nr:hypothetical protein PoB_005353200 [Plakobranchus ocellatus]